MQQPTTYTDSGMFVCLYASSFFLDYYLQWHQPCFHELQSFLSFFSDKECPNGPIICQIARNNERDLVAQCSGLLRNVENLNSAILHLHD